MFSPLRAVALAPLTVRGTLSAWQFAPLVNAGLTVLAIGYATGAWRVGQRHPRRPWPAARTGAFLAGLAVIVVATQSSAGVYDDTLLSAHMVQHVLLIMVAPPLLIYGRPLTLMLHSARQPRACPGEADPSGPLGALADLAGRHDDAVRGRGGWYAYPAAHGPGPAQ